MGAVRHEPTPSDELLDFLPSQPTPEQIIALHGSESAQERLRYRLDGIGHKPCGHGLADNFIPLKWVMSEIGG